MESDIFISGNEKMYYFCKSKMVIVAQLVRALDCGSRGRRFEPGLSPTHEAFRNESLFVFNNEKTSITRIKGISWVK